MLSRHELHLRSTYETSLQHLAEIREILTTGKTPGGAWVTPLPEPARSQLISVLDNALAELEELAAHFLPESERGRTGGIAATRMWTSALLRTVEELLEDALPVNMRRRYGPLGDVEAGLLEEKLGQVLAELSRGRQLVEEADDAHHHSLDSANSGQ
jgi:hypothetical protein